MFDFFSLLSGIDTNEQLSGRKQEETKDLEPSTTSLALARLSIRFDLGHSAGLATMPSHRLWYPVVFIFKLMVFL